MQNSFQVIVTGLLMSSLYVMWRHIVVAPFNTLISLVNEFGRLLGAYCTNGDIVRVHHDHKKDRWVTYTKGGNHFVMLNMGYMMSLLIGLVFFRLTFHETAGFILEALSILMALVAIILIDRHYLFSSLCLALLLFLAGLYLPEGLDIFIARFLSLCIISHALLDINNYERKIEHHEGDGETISPVAESAILVFWRIVSIITLVYCTMLIIN